MEWTNVCIVCFHLLLAPVFANLKEAWCSDDATECQFTLVVNYGLTMMAEKVLTKPRDGFLYRYDSNNTAEETPISADDVITADGFFEPRLVMTYNGTLPGPALHVRKGQRVRLTVINKMMQETTTVHIHGQYQRGTPYSDGVPFVTQCPILPGQTFVQSFQADPEGTFFYHAHSGPQMSNGLYGAFIVHPRVLVLSGIGGRRVVLVSSMARQPNSPNIVKDYKMNISGIERLPKLESKEHILMFQDWNHDWDSTMVTMKMRYGLYARGKKLNNTKTLAGISYSAFEYQSGLINGRGRYYDEDRTHNSAPLSEFVVEKGKLYRFRVISASDIHPFRVSIDSHQLIVVASDGHEIQPVVVESLIINSGERYDFLLLADKPVGNYWIRGRTLQEGYNHTAEAILRYKGASVDKETVSFPDRSTAMNPHVVLNCPFSYFPAGSYTYCHNYDRIFSETKNFLQAPPGRKMKQFFLNFAFPGTTETPGSVNGRAFAYHDFSALSKSHAPTSCSSEDCGEDKVCHCPYYISVDQDDLVQLVFLNMGSGQGWDHPVHMHGHSFQVVKVGYPTYNNTTGVFVRANKDIDCGSSFCNNAKWSEPSWSDGNLPGMLLYDGPLKDNILVPSGGYVVVRFKADNPGLWIIHCHLELHMMDGMAVLLNESHPQWPRPPSGFPTCHSYYGNSDQDKLNM